MTVSLSCGVTETVGFCSSFSLADCQGYPKLKELIACFGLEGRSSEEITAFLEDVRRGMASSSVASSEERAFFSGLDVRQLTPDLCEKLLQACYDRDLITALAGKFGQAQGVTLSEKAGFLREQIAQRSGECSSIACSGRWMRVFPKELFELSNLKEINCSDNEIAVLPDQFDQLRRLKKFSVDDNRLCELPESLSKSGVKVLSVSANRLSQMPKLCSLKLKKCSLAGNQLTVLAPEVVEAPKLKKFDLSGNKISGLSSLVGGLAKLDLSDNCLGLPDVDCVDRALAGERKVKFKGNTADFEVALKTLCTRRKWDREFDGSNCSFEKGTVDPKVERKVRKTLEKWCSKDVYVFGPRGRKSFAGVELYAQDLDEAKLGKSVRKTLEKWGCRLDGDFLSKQIT